MDRKLLVKVVLVSAASVVLTLLVVVGVAWAADIFTVGKDGMICLRITDTGNVGIETSPAGPGAPGARLKVLRTNMNWGLVIEGSGTMQSDVILHTPGNTVDRRIFQMVNASGDKFAMRSLTDSITVAKNFLVADMATGNVGIGTASPSTSAKLEIAGTDGALLIPRLTTAERDALTAANGMIIYNTSTNAFNFRENGAWVTRN